MLLYPQYRHDEIPDLPHSLWEAMRARVDAWRDGTLRGR